MTKQAVNIAIVGTGVIGAGWATHFLAHGFAVTATDPGEGGRANYTRLDRQQLARGRETEKSGASREKLTFTTDVSAAVRDANFIQESGPERLDVKHSVDRKHRIGG